MSIEKKYFGKLSDGREVTAFTMKAECGVSVTVMDLGATMVSLNVPDKNGELKDIVCGYDSPEEYIKNDGYTGATVGRYANRIDKGHFTLDGKDYEISKNEDGKRTLHGGFCGFDKKIWRSEAGQCGCGADRIKFYYTSEDGEEGFPGNVDVTVVYRLSADGELAIRYLAEADKMTPMALTNHSYFNLDGYEKQDISRQLLTINANRFMGIDDESISTEFYDVQDTPFDFRKEKQIGKALFTNYEHVMIPGGIDHSFDIDGTGGKMLWKHDIPLVKSVTIRSKETGIVMDIYTDAPAMQVYSGNHMGGVKYKGGVEAKKQGAICFEPGYFPNSPNRTDVPSCIFGPDRPYSSTTVYKFSVK